MTRSALIYQSAYSRPLILDGTKDITLHPTQDLKQTVKQEGHPDVVFPTSSPLTVRWTGDWPVVIPPPPGTLVYDLSFVDRTTVNYQDMLSQANRDDADAITLIRAFRLSGVDFYRQRAVSIIDSQMTAAFNDMNAGREPDLAGDSYLYADADYITPAAEVISYGNVSDALKQKVAAVMRQTYFNIWNPQAASWGGVSHPWSGWSIDNPYNNYHHHFLRLSVVIALALNDGPILNDVRNQRLPFVLQKMSQKTGGGSLEGSGYGYSYLILYDAYKYWKDSGQEDVATNNTEMANTILWWVHATLPGLNFFLPIGSQPRESIPKIYDYYRALVEEAQYLSGNTRSKSNAGWWLAHILLQHAQVYRQNWIDDLYPYNISAPQPTELTFRAAEQGLVVGRTSWASNAVLMSTLMGVFDESHAHAEQGSFIYWCGGGWGSVSNNIFTHSGIWGESGDGSAVNTLRFYNAAGQNDRTNAAMRQRYGTTTVLNFTQNAATGEFHITGDMTSLYSGAGVSLWKRTIDFVNGVATITDTFATTGGTTAKFQLNVPGNATITGNVITTPNMKATVISPSNPTINIVNMTSIDGDFQQGQRVDISGGTLGYVVKLEPR